MAWHLLFGKDVCAACAGSAFIRDHIVRASGHGT